MSDVECGLRLAWGNMSKQPQGQLLTLQRRRGEDVSTKLNKCWSPGRESVGVSKLRECPFLRQQAAVACVVRWVWAGNQAAVRKVADTIGCDSASLADRSESKSREWQEAQKRFFSTSWPPMRSVRVSVDRYILKEQQRRAGKLIAAGDW